MKEILRYQWNYILCETEGGLLLSVICGTAALYETNIFLNENETENYNDRGKEFIQELAEKIRNNPDSYRERYINGEIT